MRYQNKNNGPLANRRARSSNFPNLRTGLANLLSFNFLISFLLFCRARGRLPEPGHLNHRHFHFPGHLFFDFGRFLLDLNYFGKIFGRSKKHVFFGIAPKRSTKTEQVDPGRPVSEKGLQKSAAPCRGGAWRVRVRMKSANIA